MASVNTAAMQSMTWGTEIECVGLSLASAAHVVAEACAGVAAPEGYRGCYAVTMMDGRKWSIVTDGSLTDPLTSYSCEVVTPIMVGPAEIEIVQNVLRALRTAGARVNQSCGQHVHVGLAGLNVRQISNVVRTAYRYEEVILRAAGVQERRTDRYCKRTPLEKVLALSSAKTFGDLQRAWYGGSTYPSRYDQSRYHGINLNSYFVRGTIEFRWFEGTMHAGELRATIMLALAIVAHGAARKTRAVVIDRATIVPTKAVMGWLLSDGGVSDKTVREHLTKRLPAEWC